MQCFGNTALRDTKTNLLPYHSVSYVRDVLSIPPLQMQTLSVLDVRMHDYQTLLGVRNTSGTAILRFICFQVVCLWRVAGEAHHCNL